MNYRELVLEDFKQIYLEGNQLYYLSARMGNFEITIEEHLSVGYTIGIYEWGRRFLALEKKPCYFKNHPAGYVPDDIPGRLITKALFIANMLVRKYAETDPSQLHSISKGIYARQSPKEKL